MSPTEKYINIKYRLKKLKITYDQLSKEVGYSRIWISICMSNLKRGLVAPKHCLKAIEDFLEEREEQEE